MNAHPQVRWVQWIQSPQGFQFQCTACGATGQARTPQGVDAFAQAHAEHRSAAAGYYGAGDAVAAATKALGIESCSPCEARRRAMNGWLPRLWKR